MPIKQACRRNLTVTDHSLGEDGEGGRGKWIDTEMRIHQTKAESYHPRSVRSGEIMDLKLEVFPYKDKTNPWSSIIPAKESLMPGPRCRKQLQVMLVLYPLPFHMALCLLDASFMLCGSTVSTKLMKIKIYSQCLRLHP